MSSMQQFALQLSSEQRNDMIALLDTIIQPSPNTSRTHFLSRDIAEKFDKDLVKKILLLHTRNCTNDKCRTCNKLQRKRAAIAKRRKHWKMLRVTVKVMSVLSESQMRAALRVYEPGGEGARLAQESFNAKCSEQNDQ